MPEAFDRQGTDASAWSGEFMRIWGSRLPIDLDEGTMTGWFANAIEAGIAEGTRRHGAVGVLTYDNGEFDAYCGFFHDPAALRRAVVRLNAERLTEFHDEVDASALTIPLEAIPAVIDDAVLDRLASLVEDAVGTWIETGKQAAERRAEESSEEDEPVQPAPGQITLDGGIVE